MLKKNDKCYAIKYDNETKVEICEAMYIEKQSYQFANKDGEMLSDEYVSHKVDIDGKEEVVDDVFKQPDKVIKFMDEYIEYFSTAIENFIKERDMFFDKYTNEG